MANRYFIDVKWHGILIIEYLLKINYNKFISSLKQLFIEERSPYISEKS